MESNLRGSVRKIPFVVERGRCVCCGGEDAVLSLDDRLGASICEACASLVSLAWKKVGGEIPEGFPESDVAEVTSVTVLCARRRTLGTFENGREPELAPREMSSAYEFLLVEDEPGVLAPPWSSLQRGEDVRAGACRALESAGLRSWPALIEPLHVGYTPRGRLRAVVLARAYASADVPPQGYSDQQVGTWKPWPIAAHAGKMAGFWQFMETAWSLRLYKLTTPGQRPAEASVFMREAARRYTNQLLAGQPAQGDAAPYAATDVSMTSVYRAAMSADELAAAELVAAAEEARSSQPRQLSALRGPGDDESDSTGGESVEDEKSPGSGGGDDGDGEDGDDGDAGGEQTLEEGFARPSPRR